MDDRQQARASWPCTSNEKLNYTIQFYLTSHLGNLRAGQTKFRVGVRTGRRR